MTKAHRKRVRKARRFAAEMARRAARPTVAAGLAGSLAIGLAAPTLVHHVETHEVVSVEESHEELYPAFTAPRWPAAEPLKYRPFRVEEVSHGPHGHLPHNELIEYRYIDMTSPMISTASGSFTRSGMFNLDLRLFDQA